MPSPIERYISQQQKRISGLEKVKKLVTGYLTEDFKYPSGANIMNIADSLFSIASFESAKGIVLLSDQQSDGWELISKSLYYYYWSIRIRIDFHILNENAKLPFNGDGLISEMPTAANLLAAFISIGERKLAKSTYQLLSYMMFERAVVNSEYLRHCTFEPFIIWLYCQENGLEVPPALSAFNFGIYDGIVISYHYEHIRTTKNHRWFPIFEDSPFGVILFEIIAVLNIRKGDPENSEYLKSSLLDERFHSVERIEMKADETLRQAEGALKTVLDARN